jgi:hypothetical protein
MKNMSLFYADKAKTVCFGGLFSALAVLLQSAPVYIPGFGLALSPFSTLPVALAAAVSPAAGVISYLCSGVILLFINIQEAVIFVFATGILGLVLGLLPRKRVLSRALAAGLALFIGLTVLYRGFGIDVFGPVTGSAGDLILPAFLMFSIAYAILWSFGLKVLFGRYFKKIIKIGRIENEKQRKADRTQ